jgi:hypothetical protein
MMRAILIGILVGICNGILMWAREKMAELWPQYTYVGQPVF